MSGITILFLKILCEFAGTLIYLLKWFISTLYRLFYRKKRYKLLVSTCKHQSYNQRYYLHWPFQIAILISILPIYKGYWKSFIQEYHFVVFAIKLQCFNFTFVCILYVLNKRSRNTYILKYVNSLLFNSCFIHKRVFITELGIGVSHIALFSDQGRMI